MCSHMVLLPQFYPHCAFDTPNLENYLPLSIFMLLRPMCSHMLLLTQFYANCAFETSNFENYLHLNIFMLLRAVSLHFMLLTQFCSHCELKTFNLEYYLDLSIVMLLRAVCPHLMLMLFLCLLSIWNLQFQKKASFKSSAREAYYTRSGVRTDSLCCFIWPPGGKFMLLILLPGGRLIIQDQVLERIAYAPLFGLRAVRLCFSFCLRAGSSLYKIRCPNG